MSFAVPVVIVVKERPLYLWATLDNLYRCTQYPHKFTLVDMASEDPLVRRVIAGFERRGMFHEIVRAERNDLQILWDLLGRVLAGDAPYVGYVESDVLIEPTSPCWLERFIALMERNPRLAMLGSAIDTSDFVDMETARGLEPHMPEEQLRALISAGSPERTQDVNDAAGAEIFHPHNPAGRLRLLRSIALREVGPGIDIHLDKKFIAAGYETGIATAVRHRHLSLLHIFDYPEYDYDARRRFWAGLNPISSDLTLDSFVALRQDIALVETDGEVVIVDAHNNQYHAAGATGSRVIGLLSHDRRGHDIVAALTAVYDVNEHDCATEVLQFLRMLDDKKLLRRAESRKRECSGTATDLPASGPNVPS